MLEYCLWCQEQARAPEIEQRVFKLTVLGREFLFNSQRRADCFEIRYFPLEIGDADADVPQFAVHASSSGVIPAAITLAV